jgi:hypothetical protein
LAGIVESIQAINANMRGEKTLPDIWEAVGELDY